MSKDTGVVENCSMTDEYMGATEVAAYVTRKYAPIAAGTIRGYAVAGRMPEPDVRIGAIAGWTEASIDEWWANRPGRGRWGKRTTAAAQGADA